jgi:hypothetical protein
MSASRKGLLLAALQLALVLSLGGKLLFDRMTRPRVWVLAAIRSRIAHSGQLIAKEQGSGPRLPPQER